MIVRGERCSTCAVSSTLKPDYAGVDQYPDWSPDGKEIVFRRDIDIYAIDLTDGSVRRLTQAPVLNQMPAWAPTESGWRS